MIDTRKMASMADKMEQCPYGRRALVGTTECENCPSHRVVGVGFGSMIVSARCVGDRETVRAHERTMRAFYKSLKHEA